MPFQDLMTSLKYHNCDFIEASVTHEKILPCKALTVKSFLQKMCESPCSLYIQDNQWKEGVNKSMGFRPLLGYCRGSYFLPLSLFLHPTATMKSAGSITLSLRHRFHPHPHCSWIQKEGGGVQCDSCHLPPFQTGITLDLSHLIAFTSPLLSSCRHCPLHTLCRQTMRGGLCHVAQRKEGGGGVDRHTDKVIGDGAILSPQRERGVKSQTSRGFITRFIASGTWDAQSRLEKRYSTDIVEVFFSRVKRSPSPGHVCGKK